MTTSAPTPAADQRRLGRLFERNDGADFPFYNGRPVDLGAGRWGLLVLAAAAGFLVLALIPPSNQVVLLVSRILFVAIPLAAFIVLAGPSWKTIFRPLRWIDALTMIIFWAVNMVLSSLVAVAVKTADPGHVTANRATDQLDTAGQLILFYLGTFIQLFGEELFSLLPFLAIMYLAFTKLHLSRTASIVVAWVLTAIWFGAAHLPTYDWNLVQCFLVIGLARVVLTLAYIRTKNILVSFGAHLLTDWVIFTFTLIFAN